MCSQNGITIKLNGTLYSGTTEANEANLKRFEDDILEILDEPCDQSAYQGKNMFVDYDFYNGHHIFYDNQHNSMRTDEDFVIC